MQGKKVTSDFLRARSRALTGPNAFRRGVFFLAVHTQLDDRFRMRLAAPQNPKTPKPQNPEYLISIYVI